MMSGDDAPVDKRVCRMRQFVETGESDRADRLGEVAGVRERVW